jgi:hypothetical protein
VVLFAGAGFDPRAYALCHRLLALLPKLRVILIKEERPNPPDVLVNRAKRQLDAVWTKCVQPALLKVDIIGDDNAVVGGRNLVRQLSTLDLKDVPDVLVDLSALSTGISFPLVRFLVELKDAGVGPTNVHLLVAQDVKLDEAIVPQPVDQPGYIHGFRGRTGLDKWEDAAKLWLPQLAKGRRAMLQRLHAHLATTSNQQGLDICPILPFPAAHPRQSDELLEVFSTELESTWAIDPRQVLFAAEDDPLDLYRSLLRVHDLRERVFEEIGSSFLILSPTGCKPMATGSLLAALERNLPVIYLEAIGYEFEGDNEFEMSATTERFHHIWLEGDAYPGQRIPLRGSEL